MLAVTPYPNSFREGSYQLDSAKIKFTRSRVYFVVLWFAVLTLTSSRFLPVMAKPVGNNLGIIAWASSMRTTMANDPGRQLLEEQIQSSGFLFLEDYLEGILARPRHKYANLTNRH